MHFFKILKVPIKLVSNTRSGSLIDASIAGSAQQSIIKSNFIKLDIFLKFLISTLKFLIPCFFNLEAFNREPLR